MREEKVWELTVIGGGASGMSAAISYQKCLSRNGEKKASVLILEKNDRVGKKVLATGNGRCNLSNRDMAMEHFHSHQEEFPERVLSLIPQKETLAFLGELGILTVNEDNKLFPMSKNAASVVDAFRFALETDQITVETSSVVEEVRRVDAVGQKKLFRLTLQDGTKIFSHALIVACGGACAPSLGTTGDGYKILSSLGHKVYAPKPSIVQITTDSAVPRALSGMRMDCDLSLLCSGEVVARQFGEVLFADYGLSGPAVFQVSGEVSRRIRKGKLSAPMQVSLCLFDDETCLTLKEELSSRRKTFSDRPLEQLLLSVLPMKIGNMILKTALNRPLSLPISSLSDKDIDQIIYTMTHWVFPVSGTRSLEYAQTTIGGASCEEFSSDTMESKLVPDLYACGEVLDVDGDCGGYNLQWAFSSGILAGRSAAERFQEDDDAN